MGIRIGAVQINTISLALISDLHGNLPAVEAVGGDMLKRGEYGVL